MFNAIDSRDYGALQFHEQLGEGGFGTVHRVTFKEPYNGYTEAAAKCVTDFRKEEVEILAKLSHPHVVRLIGFYENGPIKIIVLEYAVHGSLRHYLAAESKPLQEKLKRKWIRESALGIQHLHDNKCLHRDLKASNCLLFEDYVLKLCDFGLARETNHEVTMSSQKGTYQYMAPELIDTNEENMAYYSRYADIYAYGMLVLEICTRKPPFQGMEYTYVLYHVAQGKLQPSIPRECSDDIADMMKRCWRLNPRQRPTIDKLLDVMDSTEVSPKASKAPQESTAYTMDGSLMSVQPVQSPMKVKRLACCPNGDVVIGVAHQVNILRQDATSKGSLSVEPDVWSLEVSQNGDILIIDGSRKMKVFDNQGGFVQDFSTLLGEEKVWAEVEPTCMTVDKAGRVVIGDSWRDVLTIHDFPGGGIISRINCRIPSIHSTLAANNRGQILHYSQSPSPEYSKVSAIDYLGYEMFTFTPKIDEELGGCKGIRPRGIVCDADDNIYVILKVVDGYRSVENTGHLHKYGPTGAFHGCLARGLRKPCDLAIASDGSALVIADHKAILTYHL